MERTAARRILVLIAAALCAVGLLGGPPASAAPGATSAAVPARPGDVVVNEIAAGGPRSPSDSFVELRNVSGHAVDLRGWVLYRCSAQGLRANVGRPEADLAGVALAPGDLFTIARVGVSLADGSAPDAWITQPYDPAGFGVVLVDAAGTTADSIAVYPSRPWPTESECSLDGNLPAALASVLGESWQRVESADGPRFVRATATPGAANAVLATPPAGAGVRIDEIAAAGPAGHGDDLVELVNASDRPVDASGWRIYRCTARGDATAQTLQHTMPAGSTLAPGARYTLGGPEGSGDVDARMTTSLADTVSGVMVVTADGRRVDGVTLSNHADTACQRGDDKLAATLDHRTGESWQRDPFTGEFGAAIRTPGARNRAAEAGGAAFTYDDHDVAVSELATDPAIPHAPAGYVRHNFVELANYGTRTADLGGWRVVACGTSGHRRFDTLAEIAQGTTLPPGATWLAALTGTAQATSAQATFSRELDFLGSGVWIEDAAGRRIDSVGAYHANEMDESVDPYSPCTKGLALSTFGVDRLSGQTYQRTQFTGVDAADFVAAPATPGIRDARVHLDPATIAGDAAGILQHRDAATVKDAPASTSTAPFGAPAGSGPARIVVAAAGTSPQPLTSLSGLKEQPIEPAQATKIVAADSGYDYPYVRMTVAAASATPSVSWDGTGAGRSPLRLSVWSPDAHAWRALDEKTPTPGPDGAAGAVRLSGQVRADEVSDGAVEVLVQAVPRAEPSLAGALGDFEDPRDYDFAVSHLTDTQYLTESYPDVYAEAVAWIVAHAEPRKIAFATHTGDLVQNWVDPDQEQARARAEFAVASQLQGVLDAAGIPNSVLPGNHDNKRGVTDDLFNEYFPPSRYDGTPWYGGSVAPGDNSANFSLFEAGGARMLMLSLPYGYAEREIAWAEAVVAAHPDRNVVISTHEHVSPATPDEPVRRSANSRWLSRADELWERVIAPNRNVIVVLSGHFHGIGRIVTPDAGGIAGHTVVELLADYQEFRTHTGERATGFQRLLQVDLAGGAIAVDTFSQTLDAHASFPYDYEQFVPENGHEGTPANARPWAILADGLQERYTAEDDDFTVDVRFQYDKSVTTASVWVG